MNVKALREVVNEWDAKSIDEDVASTSKYGAILKQLEFLGADEWANYVPAINPVHSGSFLVRLAAWVGNATVTADRQLLLEYARYISFFSQADFQALYMSAFNGPIARWVIEKAKVPVRVKRWFLSSFTRLFPATENPWQGGPAIKASRPKRERSFGIPPVRSAIFTGPSIFAPKFSTASGSQSKAPFERKPRAVKPMSNPPQPEKRLANVKVPSFMLMLSLLLTNYIVSSRK